MRGKGRCCAGGAVDSGIIPAHAGKSDDSERRTSAFRGSSPLMRGKVNDNWDKLDNEGIIPAHAGKSFEVRFSHFPTWDHPRSCGEKKCSLGFRVRTRGSSPLMRGKAHYWMALVVGFGIIPAHAGKSSYFRYNKRVEGSSPLMRGKADG